MKENFFTFQNIISKLQDYWKAKGCAILQPIDIEVGAGTYHHATFLRALGPNPWNAAYIQPSRRPADGRYGTHPNRAQHYYQFQVIIKPAPYNIQELYLNSLKIFGIDFLIDDIRFIVDNWESPTLGAWGVGWEVSLNGMEISQFTYFQQMGGIECNPISVEVTYGLERIAMHLQNKDDIYQVIWSDIPYLVSYGDIFLQNELEMSDYNFNFANIDYLFSQFNFYEKECEELLHVPLIFPAYEMVLKASHTFNLLDARSAIATSARQGFILKIRSMACKVAVKYCEILKKD